MSTQALVDFMKVAMADGALLDQVKRTTGAADFANLAKSKGFDLGALGGDEIRRLLAAIFGLGGAQELSGDELDMVQAAGISGLKSAGDSLKAGFEDKTALLLNADAEKRTTAFLLEVTWVSKS